jgi:hypothetical protein
MKRVLVFFVLVLGVFGDRLASQPGGPRDADLERIYQEYSSSRRRPDVSRLVLLDDQLRRLIPYWSWEGSPASSKNYRPEYSAIGVRPTLFEPDSLSYSGKLLLEAHHRDPKSHRSYTLYATVFGAEGEDGNALPLPTAAKAYLYEFPKGPFAVSAHLAAANFYADLFKVIRAEERREARDYKYECFKKFIAKGPLQPQRIDAQAQAVEHYLALTRLMPKVQTFAEWLADMRNGQSEGWHYCAD